MMWVREIVGDSKRNFMFMAFKAMGHAGHVTNLVTGYRFLS